MNDKPSTTSKDADGDDSRPVETSFLFRRQEGTTPVVGLDGSRGSITALQAFFSNIPVDSGMAFVILHFSPPRDDTFTDTLRRSTAMPVVSVTDATMVKPNCVYVIQPEALLTSTKDSTGLNEADEHRLQCVAVDTFFRSLAEAHGGHSVAVVLSGKRGDGAIGLKRIKELGGLTIAQDPDEADHPDMPRSAIAAGVVDWVLGVKEMPAKLLSYVKDRGRLRLPEEDGPHPSEESALSPDEHETALRDVLTFLLMRTGRDFSCYKRATILRRIERRMGVNGLTDLREYLVYLRTHTGEAGALLQDLLISVTNFFRDPAAFTALERSIIPELFKGKQAGDTVRVWVAGCATGEEAYSIAMLLCEHAATLVGPPHLQIIATDLNEEVIREAREGFYPETIAADVSDERLRHFFIQETGGFRLRRAVRDLVLFAPHDLLKDSPFSRLDLVSCRNLLIYLNSDAQRRAMEVFHFALNPGGRLFLGTSEAVDEGSPLFGVVDKKQRLYVQRPGPQRIISFSNGPGTLSRVLSLQERSMERPALPGRMAVERSQHKHDQPTGLESALPPAELHYRLIERLSPPSILVNTSHDIIHLSESAGRFLQFSGGEPTRNLIRTVNPMLRVELRATLYAAARTNSPTTASGVLIEIGDQRSLVDIHVTPAGDLAPNHLLVVLNERPATETAAIAAPRNGDADHAALHLERELVSTKAQLRDTIEQGEASTEELKASNEELQAMNEELRSATEELETSREELQAINEELTAVNEELKNNVDKLARSNNDLQNLMAATDIATVFLDRDLKIQRFTPSAQRLFSFIPTDIGRPLSDLSRQLDYPEIVADAERSLALLQPTQREVSAGELWYIARTLPYRTADDRIAGVVLTFLDITERKLTEQRLAESEARYRAIGESIDFGVWVCDSEGRNTYASESFLRMVGITQQQCSDFGWGDVLHPDDSEATIAAWKHCVLTRGKWDREHRFRGVDGEWHHVLARGVPITGPAGDALGWAGINLDISRLVQTEEEIGRLAADSERQRRLYETVLTNTPDFVYVFSLDYKVVYANEALIKMWGRGHEGAIGKTFLEIGYEAWHAEMHEREIDRVRATKQPIRGVVPFNGTLGRRQYDYIFVPVIGADGEVEAVAGTTRDITDRLNAEERQAFLVRLADALRPLSDPVELQAEATRALGEFLGANRVLYFEIRGDEYTVERDFTSGVQTLAGRYPVASFGPHLLTALLEGRTVVETNATTQTRRSPDEQAAFASIQVCGHVGVPLVKGGRFVAGLAVHSSEPRDWSPQEVALIEETAERTWAAVERARIEVALRQSEERAAFVRKSSGIGFWYCDLPFDRLLWDEKVKEHFGLPADFDVTIDTFYERLHPDDRDRTRQAINKSIAQREGYNIEYRTIGLDDRERWIHAIGRTGYNQAGEPIRFDGITLDITEKKIAERRLAEVTRRTESALMAGEVGTYYWDIKEDLMFGDTNFSRMFNVGQDERGAAPLSAFLDAIHPDDRGGVVSRVQATLDLDAPYVAEYRIVNAPNERWVVARGAVERDADGTPIGWAGAIVDITGRKQAERQLEESELRRRLAFEAAELGFWNIDPATSTLISDERFRMIFQASTEPITYEQAFAAIHPDDRARIREGVAAATRLENPLPYAEEYRVILPDGSVRWVYGKGRAAFVGEGPYKRLVSFDGTLADISAQVQARLELASSEERYRSLVATLEEQVELRTKELEATHRQLRLSERMAAMGTLSAGLGHDMGNLLVPVRVRLESLEKADLPESSRQDVEAIRTSAEYLRKLASGLRLLALNTDHSASDAATELRSWWEEAAPMLRNVLPSGIFLSSRIPQEQCWVGISRPALTQAVFNLVQNAGDAMRSRGTGSVTVSIEPRHDSVVITVADNGPGMPPEVRARCMEPFYTTKPREISTGLGLAFVYGLIHEAKGSMDIDTVQGQGTTFLLTLPAAQPRPSLDSPNPLPNRVAAVNLAEPRLRAFVTSELRTLSFRVENNPSISADLFVTDNLSMIDGNARGRPIVLIGTLNSTEHKDVFVMGEKPLLQTVRETLRMAAEKGPMA